MLVKSYIHGYFKPDELGRLRFVHPHVRKDRFIPDISHIIQAGDVVKIATPKNLELKGKTGIVKNIRNDGKIRVLVNNKPFAIAVENLHFMQGAPKTRAQEYIKTKQSPPIAYEGTDAKILKTLKKKIKQQTRQRLAETPAKHKIARARIRYEGQLGLLRLTPKDSSDEYRIFYNRVVDLGQRMADMESHGGRRSSDLEKELGLQVETKTIKRSVPISIHQSKIRETDLISSQREKETEQILSTGKIEESEQIHPQDYGRTAVSKVKINNIDGQPTSAIAKPREIRKEVYSPYKDIPTNQLPERARCAYLMSKTLGPDYDFVPVTVIRDGGNQYLQEFKNGREAIFVEPTEIDLNWLMRLAIFDFVSNQQNRHDTNMIIDDDKKPWAIDNDRCMGSDGKNFKSYPMYIFKNKEFPVGLLKELDKLKNKSVVSILASYVGKVPIQKMIARIDYLQKHRQFPKFFTRDVDQNYMFVLSERMDPNAHKLLVGGGNPVQL